MDYKDIAKAVRICGSEPSVRKCEKECPYYKGGDTKKCIPPMTADVAAAITDLLARAEAAEARVHELETTHLTEMCSDGYDCVQLGKARKAAADAEARAEKAEKERDAAIEDMRGICYLCANAKPYSEFSQRMMTCEHIKAVASTKSPGCKHFKWRGQKEE